MLINVGDHNAPDLINGLHRLLDADPGGHFVRRVPTAFPADGQLSQSYSSVIAADIYYAQEQPGA